MSKITTYTEAAKPINPSIMKDPDVAKVFENFANIRKIISKTA